MPELTGHGNSGAALNPRMGEQCLILGGGKAVFNPREGASPWACQGISAFVQYSSGNDGQISNFFMVQHYLHVHYSVNTCAIMIADRQESKLNILYDQKNMVTNFPCSVHTKC